MNINERWTSIIKYYYSLAFINLVMQVVLLLGKIVIPVFTQVSWLTVLTPTLYLGVFVYIVVIITVVEKLVMMRK